MAQNNFGMLPVSIAYGKEKARELLLSIMLIISYWKEDSRKTSSSASLTVLKPLTVWMTTNCGKFLKRCEYQTTWPASWETCVRQEATVRTGHGTMDWFQIGKGVHQGCILAPSLFNLYAEYIMWNARLEDPQAGIKIATGNVSNLRYVDDTT